VRCFLLGQSSPSTITAVFAIVLDYCAKSIDRIRLSVSFFRVSSFVLMNFQTSRRISFGRLIYAVHQNYSQQVGEGEASGREILALVLDLGLGFPTRSVAMIDHP
jgi:hypothetical protein